MTRTYRLLLGVVVIAAAAAAYWMLLLSPKRTEAAALATKVSVAQGQIASAQQLLTNYETAKVAYRENYAKVVRLGKAVPADDDTRSMLVQVDASAKRSGIDFDNIDLVAGTGAAAGSNVATAQSTTGLPPGAVNNGSFSVMPFTLSFSGEFGTLSDFFSRIERFVTVKGDKIQVDGRLLRVQSLNLKPIDGGWPAIQAQVGVAAYVVPKSSDAAAGATAQSPATGGATTTTTTTPPTTSTSTSDLR